ncbi:MAG: hypothetical protein K0Q68_3164 [Moraxellaceae bacterium]|jgi:hypothetical protein|nr:hypothetical protein [Moraxellaceae bacterium]
MTPAVFKEWFTLAIRCLFCLLCAIIAARYLWQDEGFKAVLIGAVAVGVMTWGKIPPFRPPAEY